MTAEQEIKNLRATVETLLGFLVGKQILTAEQAGLLLDTGRGVDEE